MANVGTMSNVWLDLVGHLFACSGLIMVSDVGTKITANAAGKEARHSCNLKLKTSLPQSSNDSTLNEGTFLLHRPSSFGGGGGGVQIRILLSFSHVPYLIS